MTWLKTPQKSCGQLLLQKEAEKDVLLQVFLLNSNLFNVMAKSPTDRLRSGSVKQKKSRHKSPKGSLQVIWGIHPVLEVLQASPQNVKEVIVDRGSGTKTQKIIELVKQQKITVRYDKDEFTSSALQESGLTDEDRHQGVIARISFPYHSFTELLDNLQNSTGIPFILALDSIQDPQNLGAIIRSAVAAGFTRIILPKDRAAQITGSVAKASAGAVFHVDVCRVTNLVASIDALKEKGIWVFGTAKDAPLTIYEADFTVPACLVIGNEEKGLRPRVKEHCDMLVTIPMPGKLDSLNVSVATGVVLFEIVRQRII
jgi:23S rRNA (guanosine2251-2'-O)-methyltransferase